MSKYIFFVHLTNLNRRVVLKTMSGNNDLVVVLGVNCFMLNLSCIMYNGFKVADFWDTHMLVTSIISLVVCASYLIYSFVKESDDPVGDTFRVYGEIYIILLSITASLIYFYKLGVSIINHDNYDIIVSINIAIWFIGVYLSFTKID